jgi:hypothetical protein
MGRALGLFHRKSRWEQLSEPVARAVPVVAKAVPGAAKSALRGVGAVVGVSAASAAVSAARQRQSRG